MAQFRTILEYFPHAAMESVGNMLVKQWRSCLVSFHAKKPHHDHTILTIGTGFLLTAGNSFAITTAQHVLREYAAGNGLCVLIDGQQVSLDGLQATQSEQEDCAFVPPPATMAGREWTALAAGRRDDVIETSSFMIFGYPESRNRFDVRRPGQGLDVLNIVCHGFEHDWKRGQLTFRYDPRTVYFEDGSTFDSAPHLRGMSGSPVAQLLVSRRTGEIGLRPVGIFTEWHQASEKRLLAHCFPDFGRELDPRWNDIS